MGRIAAVVLVTLVLAPGAARAQGTPLGPEFRVNTYTTSFQRVPSVASDSSGNFVVVWNSLFQDGSGYGVYGQRYDSSGTPLGPEFRVNTYTTEAQDSASVSSDASGNFVVVWHSDTQDGSGYGVFGQRYASSGAPLGPEFRVNSYTTGAQEGPSIASDSAGNFVVIWYSYMQDGSGLGIFGQRYANSGAPLGSEFRINTYTTGRQAPASVSSDASGNFVVVWASDAQDGSGDGVFGQRYASSGAPLGPEFRVNTYTTGYQGVPDVVSDSAGGFVVVWHGIGQDGSGVLAQRYASSGVPLGPEFRVNTYATIPARDPSVASDSSGDFVVVWQALGGDGSYFGVFGQRFANSGAPLGPEFRVNTYTTGDQEGASVSSDASGNFVVAWASSLDGSLSGIYGQRYSEIVPVELMRFGVE